MFIMKRTLAIIMTAIMLVSVLALGVSAEAGKGKDSVVEAAYGTPVIDGTIDDIWSKLHLRNSTNTILSPRRKLILMPVSSE